MRHAHSIGPTGTKPAQLVTNFPPEYYQVSASLLLFFPNESIMTDPACLSSQLDSEAMTVKQVNMVDSAVDMPVTGSPWLDTSAVCTCARRGGGVGGGCHPHNSGVHLTCSLRHLPDARYSKHTAGNGRHLLLPTWAD